MKRGGGGEKPKIINSFPHNPDFYRPRKRSLFGNIVGKRENAGNQYFLLFPQFFQPIPKRISAFNLHLFRRLQML